MTKLPKFFALALVAAMALVACGPVPSPTPGQLGAGSIPLTMEVDVIFREFYNSLGGEAVLGKAITGAFTEGENTYQFFQTALLVFNPNSNRVYKLANLGKELNYATLAAYSIQPSPGDEVRNGFMVYSAFLPMIAQLERFTSIGQPITGPIINQENNRIEQHFEKVGFYQPLDGGPIHMLPYGLLACNYSCQDKIEKNSAPENPLPDLQPYELAFAEAWDALGSEFLGDYLAGVYRSQNGNYMLMFFKNVVLYTTENGRRAFALPIVEELGIKADPPTTALNNPYVIFVPTQGDLGHNIPLFFYNYLSEHGGLDIAGNPITEFFQTENTIRQCFENLCLDYFESAPEGQRVRTAPLGKRYLNKFYSAPGIATPDIQFNPGTATVGSNPNDNNGPAEQPNTGSGAAPVQVTLKASESESLITSQESQTIFINVYENGKPLANQQPELIVTLPNGTQQRFTFPRTGNNGFSQVNLPPIEGQNGDLVDYQVCLNHAQAGEICANETFLIWGN